MAPKTVRVPHNGRFVLKIHVVFNGVRARGIVADPVPRCCFEFHLPILTQMNSTKFFRPSADGYSESRALSNFHLGPGGLGIRPTVPFTVFRTSVVTMYSFSALVILFRPDVYESLDPVLVPR